MKRKKKIIVAPLNWGLGHASRCIPVIRELLKQEVNVLIAGNGGSLLLLQKEFPSLRCILLPGHTTRYPVTGHLVWNLIFQLPQIILSGIREHRAIKRIIRDEDIDAIISDNRYGLYSDKIPCILIIHQVFLMAPKGFKWLGKPANRINQYLINKFYCCWIPDYEGEENLSGDLGHSSFLPKSTNYIGPISRLSFYQTKKKRDVLILLSGPEPQRSFIEKILTQKILELINNSSGITFKFLMVRGIPERNETIELHPNFSKVDFMNSGLLNEAILSSEVVITRPGYSTVMDIAALQKKAIFIPTPDQAEQEYLSEYYFQKKLYYSESQSEIDLKRALENYNNFSGFKKVNDKPLLKNQIQWLLEQLD
ncbi:MAG: glycosyltransferase [Chitinophagales bacterium]|nr:glycosyltransferase [Chitinophagales bacterium]